MREAIVVRNLSYTYSDGGTKALEGVDFMASEGERVAIIGPNGAGKTTLLNHLNGIFRPDGGIVEVFGRDVKGLKREEITERVGVAFQDPDDQLFMPTVFDNVAFGPMNLGLKEDEVKERVGGALSTVGLSDCGNKSPPNLSYGEKKKASLAAVLSIDPRILVLDEPTANLDPESRKELIGVVRELNEQKGITVVIATHDVNAIPEIADRVYVLNKRIISEGSPRKIFSDTELLKENDLEVPEVFKLFEVLECFGYDCEDLPLSIDEAIEELTETIETKDGHVHLHIHEHTHEDIKKLKEKYGHH